MTNTRRHHDSTARCSNQRAVRMIRVLTYRMPPDACPQIVAAFVDLSDIAASSTLMLVPASYVQSDGSASSITRSRHRGSSIVPVLSAVETGKTSSGPTYGVRIARKSDAGVLGSNHLR